MKKNTSPYYLVIGLGTSGISMAKFLRSRGEAVIATDIDDSRRMIEKDLQALGIQTEIGFHSQDTFDHAKVLVPSPGIPTTLPYIKAAVQKGVALTGELDIFTRYNTLPVIAITGTNGKTTTTTLIGQMLQACGKHPFVGGNIGTPLVDLLMTDHQADVVVAEISSFQLDISNRFKPDVALLLNISEDHLDRYPHYAAYRESKWRIFNLQSASDKAVINRSIKGFDQAVKSFKAELFDFSSDPAVRSECSAAIHPGRIDFATRQGMQTLLTSHLKELQGTHNRENIAAAALACLSVGADIQGIQKGLDTFKNLPHRMNFVRTLNGISFYNDSKATNTDAVIRAIECFDNHLILILGGREKGTDFSLLADSIQKHVKTIIALGEAKQHILRTFHDICPVLAVQTMKEAVQTAFETASEKDVVLLSPACASFDMYDNYSHRGNDFSTHVNALGKR